MLLLRAAEADTGIVCRARSLLLRGLLYAGSGHAGSGLQPAGRCSDSAAVVTRIVGSGARRRPSGAAGLWSLALLADEVQMDSWDR